MQRVKASILDFIKNRPNSTRYEVDLALLKAGYKAEDIEVAWQQLEFSSKSHITKPEPLPLINYGILFGSLVLFVVNYLVGTSKIIVFSTSVTAIIFSCLSTLFFGSVLWYSIKLKDTFGNFVPILIALGILIFATVYCYFWTFMVLSNFCCAP